MNYPFNNTVGNSAGQSDHEFNPLTFWDYPPFEQNDDVEGNSNAITQSHADSELNSFTHPAFVTAQPFEENQFVEPDPKNVTQGWHEMDIDTLLGTAFRGFQPFEQPNFAEHNANSMAESHEMNPSKPEYTTTTASGITNRTKPNTDYNMQPQQLTVFEQPARGPNVEGTFVCNHHECRGLTFSRKSEYTKHMNKHERPYKCNVPRCYGADGFSTRNLLYRHKRFVHQVQINNMIPCSEPGCTREYTRRDSLIIHMQQQHKKSLPGPGAALTTFATNSIIQPVVRSESSQRKRRRQTEATPNHHGDSQADTERTGLHREVKRLKQVERGLGRALEEGKEREEELKKELKKAEKKIEEWGERLMSLMEILHGVI